MNKRLIEPLSSDELKIMMRDTAFADFYNHAQLLGKYIQASDVRKARFGDITYKRLMAYRTHAFDTSFFLNKSEAWIKEYDQQQTNYDEALDSVIHFWHEYQEKYDMASRVNIEFAGMQKEFFSFSGEVSDVYIGFEISPIKCNIDQLRFRYEMLLKSNDSGSAFDDHSDLQYCTLTTAVSSPGTFYWKADYDTEKAIMNLTADEVDKSYDFNIEVIDLRINGVDYQEKLNEIPNVIQVAFRLDDSWRTDEEVKAEIIKSEINPNYQSFLDFVAPLIQAELRNYDQDVFDLITTLSEWDPNLFELSASGLLEFVDSDLLEWLGAE